MAIPEFIKVVGSARSITMSTGKQAELLSLKAGELKIRGRKRQAGFDVLVKDQVVDQEAYVTERGVLVGNLFSACVGHAAGFLEQEVVDNAVSSNLLCLVVFFSLNLY